MKKLATSVVVLLCVVMTACNKKHLDNVHPVQQPSLAAMSLEGNDSVFVDHILEINGSGCNLPPMCKSTEYACATGDCWIPVACCHEISIEAFLAMRKNLTHAGTVVLATDLEDIVEATCEPLRVSDANPTTDANIVLNGTDTTGTVVLYNIAIFKGIFQMTPGAVKFIFYNGTRVTTGDDIIFKVVFADGSEKFYDFSEEPPNK